MGEDGESGERRSQTPRKTRISLVYISALTLFAISTIGSYILLLFDRPSTRNIMDSPTLGTIKLVLEVFGTIGIQGILILPPLGPWTNKERRFSMVGFWLMVAAFLLAGCFAIASTVFTYFVAPPGFLQPFMGPYLYWTVLALVAFVVIAPAIWIIQLIYQAITQAKASLKTEPKSHEP